MRLRLIALKVFVFGLLGGAHAARACTPSYQVLRSKPEAPVTNIIEVAGCYSRPTVDVSPEYVQGCLDAVPTDVEDLMIRTRCLTDALKLKNLTEPTIASVNEALRGTAAEAKTLEADAQSLSLVIERGSK